MTEIILFNKPYGVLCQFSGDQGRPTLADYIDAPGYYAAGRLDRDSEGLLILTDNGKLQAKISSPKNKMPKTYLTQVEGEIKEKDLTPLRKGIELKDGKALPASCKIVDSPLWLWERNPPIRERKNIPTSWIELELKEGKNRQVRRMTAAIGFPTLRLIRTAIGHWSVADIQLGKQKTKQV